MEPLALHLLKKVGGGFSMWDDGSGDGAEGGGWGGDSYDISYGDYWDSHVPDYEFQVNYDGSMIVSDSTRDAMSMLSSAAGWGAGAVVTGACVGVPAALSGPAALEVAALMARPCAVIGTAAGVATGIWVGNRLAARIKVLTE